MENRFLKRIARASREFDIFVRRAATRGELDLAELVDAYVALEPSGHIHLAHPRKICLETLSEALRRLPIVLNEVDEVRLVSSIEGFDIELLPGVGFRSGLMNDGSLLIELPDGIHSLMSFAAHACALVIEWSKIRALLDADQSDTSTESDHFEPESADEALAAAGIDTGPEFEPRPETDRESELESEPESDGIESAPAGIAPPDISELAFDLGVDEHTLLDSSAKTRGVLFEMVNSPVLMPRIRVHADLASEQAEHRGAQLGREICESVLELGLNDRPIHLWIGNDVVTDCLSPYARELRKPLVDWAQKGPDGLGHDLGDLATLVDESTLYAIIRDFSQTDARIRDERRVADTTVGIQRLRVQRTHFEVIDFQQIDPTLIDARIHNWAPNDASILLRVDRPEGVDEHAFLSELLDGLGSALRSVTVLLRGTLLRNISPAAIILPHLMIRWSGEEKLSLPGARALELEHFMGLAESDVGGGSVLSMPTATLLNANHIEALARKFRVAAIEVGGDGLLTALHDALWSGVVDPNVAISWPLVDQSRVNRRPSVAALTAASSVAVALLRSIGAPTAPPEPEPERKPATRPPRPTMRIRA